LRDYGKVHTSFWSSATIRSLSEDGRTLALYLMTSPHTTIAGVFRLPDGYVCEDLQWSPERVAKGFEELLRNGFANRCETTKWLWIVKHLAWNPPENPNQCKAAAKCADGVPDECAWKLDFMRVCGPRIGLAAPPKPNRSRTVAKPFRNQEQKQEQKQDSGGFAEFWLAYPRKDAKDDALKAFQKIAPDAELLALMVTAIKAQGLAERCAKGERKFVPMPATWLNGKRWQDEPSTAAADDIFAGAR
jgi:hypothetical protein